MGVFSAVDIFKVTVSKYHLGVCLLRSRRPTHPIPSLPPPVRACVRAPRHPTNACAFPPLSLSLSLSLCVAVLPFARWHSQTRHHHPDDEDAPPPPPPPPPPLPRSTSQPAWLQDPVRTENSRGGWGWGGGSLCICDAPGPRQNSPFLLWCRNAGVACAALHTRGAGRWRYLIPRALGVCWSQRTSRPFCRRVLRKHVDKDVQPRDGCVASFSAAAQRIPRCIQRCIWL